MSMSFCAVAAPSSVDDFLDLLREHLADYELKEVSDELANADAMFEWCGPRSEYLEGAFPDDAKALYGHGDWTVLLDFSMLLSTDSDLMQSLSRKLGVVLIATSQGTAGYASFERYQDGELARRIVAVDGELTQEGAALDAESQIDLKRFYFDEADVLWKSHGLPSFLEIPGGPFIGVHLVDQAPQELPAPEKAQQQRPWWRFW